MTTPDPFNITKEIDKLTSEVEQDREAGVFLGKPPETPLADDDYAYQPVPLKVAGHLVCMSPEKHKEMLARLDHLEAENARLNEQHKADNAMIRRVSERVESELTAATSRAEQAERERDEYKSLWHQEARKGPECQF